MKSTMGRPRSLSSEQLNIILCWYVQREAWKALRRASLSRSRIAADLGVSVATIDKAIARLEACSVPPDVDPAEVWISRLTSERRGKVGRPPVLVGERLMRFVTWYIQLLAWMRVSRMLRKRVDLARRLNVCKSTIEHAIFRRGKYKSVVPEERGLRRAQRHQQLARLRARGFL